MNIKSSYPKITIVTPNYNQDTFLENTILSVIKQNYPNLEYIIIDGGSSDNSVNIIKKYEKYLHYWVSEKDNSMYEAIQKGFDKSSGEIMAWINSDDMYHKKSFFTVSEIFDNLKNIQWLTGANTNYDESGRTFNVRSSHEHNKYSQFLAPFKYIQQESTFWRRSLWEKVGSTFNMSLKYAGDFDLWLRFNRFEQVYITDALVGGFRVRKDQLSQVFMDKYKEECVLVLEKEQMAFSFYQKSILKEIRALSTKLNFQGGNEADRVTYKNKIISLSHQKNKIIFNLQNQKFEIKDSKMNTVLSTITKRRNNMRDFLEMVKLNHSYYPEVVIDVGVANGTPDLYVTFPESQFILFEALEEFMPSMQKHKENIKHMDIELCALGSKAGKIEINVHPDLVGSSIYLEQEDSDVNGEKRSISMKTLNGFDTKYGLLEKSILLKIDVQGAEIDVLEGAKNILPNVDIIILEVSFFSFFENTMTFTDIITYMDKNGFVTYDIFSFSNRPLDSALAQVDIAFVKKDSIFREQHIFSTKEQRARLNYEIQDNYLNASPQIISSQNSFDFSKQFNILYRQIEELKNSGEKYIIYGAGTISNLIYSFISDKIVAKVDRKSTNISKQIDNDVIYSPENLSNMEYDRIIISVLGREVEIIDYLSQKLNINLNKIVTFKIDE